MNGKNKLMEAALDYVRGGWKVIPLHNWDGSKCSCNKADCESAGKHPRIAAWKENATIIEGQIQGWWLKWPEANIGIVTGAQSGLVVIDLDGPEGKESFQRLSQEHDYTCDTLVSKTGNGCHLYYKHPGGDISNSARTVADGVDVRGDGGYIVAPPSMHKSGCSYRWRQDERQLQDLPRWLHEALLKSKGVKRQAPSAKSASRLIPEGSRNSHLTSLAGTMRRRGLSEAVMAAALLEENRESCSPQLSESEVRRIAQSVSQYEAGSNGGSKSDETISQRLIRLADQASFFHTPDGEAFASVVDSSGKRENWPTGSKDFTTWLTRCYWQETKSASSKSAVAEALAVLEGKALFDGPEVNVHTRVAEANGTIYLDLADPERRVVEISKLGWNITTDPPVKFRRAKGMRPLPVPVAGGSVEELRRFVNVDSETDWVLLISWLLAAFRPRGPYPLAGLHGEHGSAKSTTARVMRDLVDPNVSPLRCEPRSIQDFMIAAANGWVIALDNLSRVDGWLSDALCRLSTGGGFSTRTLYENSEETILEAQRPVILTGIEELATKSDLLDRSLVIYLPSIPESERKTEKSFWEDFVEAHPRILGSLLDAVTCALRELPNVKLEALPRLADFATWITAAEPGLGWESGAFLQAYKTNREEANNVALEASLLATPIVSLVDKGLWAGTAEQLLRRLETSVPDTVRRAPEWPKTARSLSGALRRMAPNLRPLGIHLTFCRDKTRERNRIVTIDRPVPSNPSEGAGSWAVGTL